MAIIITGIIIFLLLWNWNFWFYHEPYTKPLPAPDESKCFSPRCRSIIKEGGGDRVILMVHGFPSCPQVFEYFADYFSKAGYDVRAPLIPGFGTSPKDLEHTSFAQWYDYIARVYEGLRARYKQVFVLGLSMGGAITLRIGETYSGTDKAPDGLVSISAPVCYNSLHDRVVASPFVFVGRIVSVFFPVIGIPRNVSGKPNGEDGNEDWTGYHGMFARQGITLIYHLKPIRRDLKKITVPLLAIQDKKDKTVPPKNLDIISRENGSNHFKRIQTDMEKHHHTYHCLPMYHSIQHYVADQIAAFLKEISQ
ncbi:MAG: alpha/beta fold hydrolase [Sphaerochaetaceae bacterium]